MRQQLGRRCPECGAGDAPQLMVPIQGVMIAACPRCGREVHMSQGAVGALAAFYGQQEEGAIRCVTLEPDLIKVDGYDEPRWAYQCQRFGLMGPVCKTKAEALKQWNELVGGGR